MVANDDPTNPVEEALDELAASAPKFLAQVEEARSTPFGISKLYNTYKTALRAWTVISLLSIAAVPLILFVAWRSSWWLLLALVLPPLTFYLATFYGTISRKRMELLRPLAAAQNQTFLAETAQRLAAKAAAEE